MWRTIVNLFGGIKNIIIAAIGLFIGGYAIKAKYDKHKAEEALEDLQNAQDKTNIEITKENANNREKAKKIESNAEIDNLRDIIKIKEKVKEELKEAKKIIDESGKEKSQVTGRKRGKAFTIKV